MSLGSRCSWASSSLPSPCTVFSPLRLQSTPGHYGRGDLTRSSNPARSDLTGFFSKWSQTPGSLGQRILVWHCPVSVFCQSTLCPLSVVTQELRSLSDHTPQLLHPRASFALWGRYHTAFSSSPSTSPKQVRVPLHFRFWLKVGKR